MPFLYNHFQAALCIGSVKLLGSDVGVLLLVVALGDYGVHAVDLEDKDICLVTDR